MSMYVCVFHLILQFSFVEQSRKLKSKLIWSNTSCRMLDSMCHIQSVCMCVSNSSVHVYS